MTQRRGETTYPERAPDPTYYTHRPPTHMALVKPCMEGDHAISWVRVRRSATGTQPCKVNRTEASSLQIGAAVHLGTYAASVFLPFRMRLLFFACWCVDTRWVYAFQATCVYINYFYGTAVM